MIELNHPAKNVILFMGDGMGVPTSSAARIYMAQSRNLTGEEAQLSWERMPHVALSKVNFIIDSIRRLCFWVFLFSICLHLQLLKSNK